MAPNRLKQLVDLFKENEKSYKSGLYNEAQARIEFINPFFELLGWDISNKKGLPEAYKEVISEDSLKMESSTKAPDYAFRINGRRIFYVEAKKPSIHIKEGIPPAFQLRSYAWSAKMSLSILTDFEEFAVYDCRIKPFADDKASVARVMYLNYKEYIDKWDDLVSIFSPDAILSGSFDKYADDNKLKKGFTEVDDDFVMSLNKWRELLARNIVVKNENIGEDELNFSIQKIIDRMIFLRICEDRGVEIENQLMNKISTGIYSNLKILFHTADRKYNSGLFDYAKDTITDSLTIDDDVLQGIIEEMYYPKSSYRFSVIPVEILGHSYEQYLGKVIKITDGHKIDIEEKPEVRKAGGVYYTPQYIVDYIVKNTVGKLIEGKTAQEVEKIKICDPACGSGSFLLGAYQHLLDWHQDYFTKAKIKQKQQYFTPDGRLTTSIKKQILLNNIFGVDIDTNAVEVTKLSLMLKAMEDETDASINMQLNLVHERVLPSLDENIKSGNSLIDMDFYSGEFDFEPGAEKKIKPFSWKNSFPEVFAQGGFDAVIGNPPYFSLDTISIIQKNYIENKFQLFATRQSNIYFFFMAVAHDILRDDGTLSFINERYFLNSKNALNFRKYLQNHFKIIKIVDFKNIQIFDNVNTLTIINTFEKTISNRVISVMQFNDCVRKLNENIIEDISQSVTFELSQDNLDCSDWNFSMPKLQEIRTKFFNYQTLDNIMDMGQGLKSGLNETFIVDERTIAEFNIEKEILRKYVKTRDIQRYNIYFRDLYLILALNNTEISNYPNTYKYLHCFHSQLSARYQFKDGVCKWYSLSIPQNLNLFQKTKAKILTPLYSKGNKFGYDNNDNNYYALTDTFILVKKDSIDVSTKYLLALLNSSLMNFFNKHFGKLKRDGYYEYSRNTLSKYPIALPRNNSEIVLQNKIESNVETMLQLNKDLQSATLPEQKEHIKQRIAYTDKKIDSLVYQLYDLTEEEIRIVEGDR